jgi:hypothetical protein
MPYAARIRAVLRVGAIRHELNPASRVSARDNLAPIEAFPDGSQRVPALLLLMSEHIAGVALPPAASEVPEDEVLGINELVANLVA